MSTDATTYEQYLRGLIADWRGRGFTVTAGEQVVQCEDGIRAFIERWVSVEPEDQLTEDDEERLYSNLEELYAILEDEEKGSSK